MTTVVDNTPIVPNAKRLLWAGFMAILAAGVGFAIRGGIFDNWARSLDLRARNSAPSAGQVLMVFVLELLLAA
ncbi:MAG: hypothetical protein M3Y82_09645 [Verrucomicrobiota bacterium]|nr:hypothetical protein [Verrucomicrobiota bacterium]